MKHFFPVIIIFYVSLSSVACFLSSPESKLHPPATFPLSRSVLGYVVITDSYTQLLDRRGSEGVSLGVLRKGTILPVLERRLMQGEAKTESWIYVAAEEKGWIRESSGQVFQTEGQAKTALRNLLQGQ
jgi:hypothetical protein